MLTFDEETHTYRNDDVILPSVTEILVSLGFINTHWFTAESRNRGTAVHLAVRDHCCGIGCAAPTEEVESYLRGYRRFEKECNWKPEKVETPMACNLYAGTPDTIGLLNDCLAVVDFKSGEVGPATGLQLQGYRDLHFWGQQTDREQIMKRFALQLTKEGKYRLTEYRDRSDQYIWRSAVAIWHWKRNHGI